MNLSLQSVVHDTAALLLWHVQQFVAISWPGMELQWTEFFHQISIVLQKALVKWASALKWWRASVETEWWIVKQTTADLDSITMI